jgi:ribokinase
MHPELVSAIEKGHNRLRDSRAVLLPDLFIDHLVPVPGLHGFEEGTRRLVKQGGGNLLYSPQQTRLGGNAANTGFALARLGVPVTLVAMTDPVGRLLWEEAVRGLPAETKGLISKDRASRTVALELQEESANVMLSDPGPLADFGPGDLDMEAWGWIEEADLVVATNWAQAVKHGTELFEQVITRAHRAGAFTFLDTGDPAHRPRAAWDLLRSPLFASLSAWGVNEHEVRFYAGCLLDRPEAELDVEDALSVLARHTKARVDLHTHTFALSMDAEGAVQVPSFPVHPRFRTGAGDAWNAGNLVGYLLGVPARSRLTLAHAVATLTIGGEAPGPPTMEQVVGFLQEN